MTEPGRCEHCGHDLSQAIRALTDVVRALAAKDAIEADRLLYDLKGAAAALSMSEATLRREYQAGRIIFRRSSRKYYVARDELLRYIAEMDAPGPGE